MMPNRLTLLVVNYYSVAIYAIFNVAGINIQHATGATNACPSTT